MNNEVMNSKKTGEFICNLRKYNGMTQLELAEKIPISRQAVSKWERGETIPDASSLIKLSVIFNVTINEILYGERIENNKDEINDKISLKLLDKQNKLKRVFKILILIIIFLLLSFLIYYFSISYNRVEFYTITGRGNIVYQLDGNFFKGNNKIYFRLGDFEYNKYDLELVTLYYIDREGNEEFICSHSGNNSIVIFEIEGYDEYFDSKNIDYIIDNMYVKFSFNDNVEDIVKLNLHEEYKNNKFYYPLSEKVYE